MDNSQTTEAPAEVETPTPYVPKRWSNHRIEITDAEKLQLAWQFARENNMQAQFAEAFMGLLALISGFHRDADAQEKDLYAHIGFDGCDHSFRWWVGALGLDQKPNGVTRGNGFMMNGGLIYHGRGAGETFTATLTSGAERPWQIHT